METEKIERTVSNSALIKALRVLRLRLAAWIAGGTLYQYEGRQRSGQWVNGPVIITPVGLEAMRAALWSGSKTLIDTAMVKHP